MLAVKVCDLRLPPGSRHPHLPQGEVQLVDEDIHDVMPRKCHDGVVSSMLSILAEFCDWEGSCYHSIPVQKKFG